MDSGMLYKHFSELFDGMKTNKGDVELLDNGGAKTEE